MSIFAIIAAAGLALASTDAPSSEPVPRSAARASGEGNRSGSGGKKGSGQKKGKKGGKKKGKKGKKGGKTSGPTAPWGKARVVVAGGFGYGHVLTRESAETGKEGESATGSSSSTCIGNDCTSADSNTNAASGWGSHAKAAVLFPGVIGLPRMAGPKISFSRNTGQLTGLKNRRAEDASGDSLTTTFVQDRADYALALQQIEVGMAYASKFVPTTRWFVMVSLSGGYAWGTVDTTLQSASSETITGTVRGPSIGFDVGLGVSLGKHAHLMLMPMTTPTWIALRPDNPDSFPFPTDSKAYTSTIPAKLELMASF